MNKLSIQKYQFIEENINKKTIHKYKIMRESLTNFQYFFIFCFEEYLLPLDLEAVQRMSI